MTVGWGEPAFRAGQRAARTALLEVLGTLSDLGARRSVADTLEATTVLLEAHGRIEAPARLPATSEALRLALHEPQIPLPALTAPLAGCRGRVEATLGAGAIAAAALEAGDDLQKVLRLARTELEGCEA